MARSLLGFDVAEPAAQKRGGAFLWTVVLLLLTGMAMTSWIGSFYIVAHPENPRCYRILKRLKKLDPPKQFAVTEGPYGRFLSAKQLLEGFAKSKPEELIGFGKMGPAELAQKNAELMRMYLKNYGETKQSVPYVAGMFEVVEAHKLGATDFFPSGVVAVAQSKDTPQVLMEMVFPATAASAETIRDFLPIGREITLERSRDLAAVVHVERLSDSRMVFTVVPLSYGSFQLKEGRGSFTLKSPRDLVDPTVGGDTKNEINIEGPLPIVNGIRLQKGLAAHAEHRRKVLASSDSEHPRANQLIAFRTPATGSDTVEVATPTVIREAPSNPPLIVPPPAVRPPVPRPITNIVPPTQRPQLISNTAPAPMPERFPLPPRPIIRATPQPPKVEPQPAAPAPETEPPKPVVLRPAPVAPEPPAAAPKPEPPKAVVISRPIDSPPAEQKRRVLSAKEASALVDSFDPTSESMLGGEFVVTGVLEQRVALRARESLRDPDADPTKAGSTGAMIIVDFPKGVIPPAKDTTFSREGSRGFLIKSVRRSGTGQITIFAEDARKP